MKSLQGLKVAVPTAVLIDGEQPLRLFRNRDQLGSFVVGRSEGLVDNDVATGLQALFGLLEMRRIRGSYDDEAD